MLAVLPHGLSVDPEIVKLITVRSERSGGVTRHSVVMRTDADDNLHTIATFTTREEAEELCNECADTINENLDE